MGTARGRQWNLTTILAAASLIVALCREFTCDQNATIWRWSENKKPNMHEPAARVGVSVYVIGALRPKGFCLPEARSSDRRTELDARIPADRMPGVRSHSLAGRDPDARRSGRVPLVRGGARLH